VGRSVDGGDGDNGSSGVLPGCGGSGNNLLSLFEPFAQFAKQGNTLVQTVGYQQTSVAHQEETNSNQGATSSNDLINDDDIDFDKCFSELFPDLAVAEAGINL